MGFDKLSQNGLNQLGGQYWRLHPLFLWHLSNLSIALLLAANFRRDEIALAQCLLDYNGSCRVPSRYTGLDGSISLVKSTGSRR